jgi:hypothetical protein
MTDEEIEQNKELQELLHSNPIIDFIYTTPVKEFEMNGKIHFIQY